jgi:peptidoglycan-associated lipoprotein
LLPALLGEIALALYCKNMKILTFTKLLFFAVILSLGATGCKKTPKSPTPIFGRTTPPPRGAQPMGPENTGPIIPMGQDPSSMAIPANPEGTPLTGTRDDLSHYDHNREVFQQQTVYFDFDRFNVKPSEVQKAESVANYMMTQPQAHRLLIEGHCDERGTPGYNLALGERRALAVREFLISLGISAGRITTISYGEDKPADYGQSEAAYARNRRAEFILLTPKADF